MCVGYLVFDCLYFFLIAERMANLSVLWLLQIREIKLAHLKEWLGRGNQTDSGSATLASASGTTLFSVLLLLFVFGGVL